MARKDTIEATDLQLDAANVRKHGPRNMKAIEDSLSQFGAGRSILLDKNGVVRAGNGTAQAWMAQGGKVRIIETDGTELVAVKRNDLDGAEATAYAIADNRTAELAEWDTEALGQQLESLTEFDAVDLGFDSDALDELFPEDATPDEVVEDTPPEPPADPITQPGDLWILGEHRLLCGDSTNADDVARLMDGVIAEMMFTDPPYGVDYEGGHFHSGDVKIKRKRSKLGGDGNTDIYGQFLPVAVKHVDGPCYMWFAGSKALPVYQAVQDCGGVVSALLIWHKTNATYAAMNAQYKQRHEPCLYFKPKGSTLRWVGPTDAATLWEFKRDPSNDLHPTQKPVCLAANAIKNHKASTVADFFCGSGSTLIAAEQLGRKCYGLEISPAYCDVIVERWEKLTGEEAQRHASE